MIEQFSIQSIDVMMPTTDQWNPNYPGNMVRVSLHHRSTGKDHCVCVWGDDDDGMELFTDDFSRVAFLFAKIIKKKVITKAKLTEYGLVQA